MNALFGIFIVDARKITGVLDKAFLLTSKEIVVAAIGIGNVRFALRFATSRIAFFGTCKQRKCTEAKMFLAGDWGRAVPSPNRSKFRKTPS
jgi:hypothetical protein